MLEPLDMDPFIIHVDRYYFGKPEIDFKFLKRRETEQNKPEVVS